MKKDIEQQLRKKSTIIMMNNICSNYCIFMSEFYFFNLFFEVLKYYGFNANLDKITVLEPIDIDIASENKKKIKMVCRLTITKGDLKLITKFDDELVPTYLKDYNNMIRDNRFNGLEKYDYLIDTFLKLL